MNKKNDWFVKKQEKFFFCYSEKIASFLIEEKGLSFITEAFSLHGHKFVLFETSEQLDKALKEYQQMKN
ncbi:hypothetical protein SAMN05444673_2189 [Bacillus sp. OV166]|uniref:hypothetical protein n=1 Tax=Bacillus sp. OV166 TaxID=1882763 RepID=UPI000A2AC2E8|nr:hypothetical protein [Bacillus sp. OV166]SMQ72396.1 hypothetical protein SAMN05444673_2189 [Bacillus sp. OV166]